MLEPFEKGRINISELQNHSWIKITEPKRKKIELFFTSEKFLIEMMKADFISYKSSETLRNEINNFYKLSFVDDQSKIENILPKVKTFKKKSKFKIFSAKTF